MKVMREEDRQEKKERGREVAHTDRPGTRDVA
jgi:hypothetical protein